MKIIQIIYPKVVVQDMTTNAISMKHADDFGNTIYVGAVLEYRDHKYYCINKTVDENCVGGSCPVK